METFEDPKVSSAYLALDLHNVFLWNPVVPWNRI